MMKWKMIDNKTSLVSVMENHITNEKVFYLWKICIVISEEGSMESERFGGIRYGRLYN